MDWPLRRRDAASRSGRAGTSRPSAADDGCSGALAPHPGLLAREQPRDVRLVAIEEQERDHRHGGGKNIRALQEETGVKIDIEEDGTVYIASTSAEGAKIAQERIAGLGESAVVGNIYTGKVVRIEAFGAFVNIMPGIDGLDLCRMIRNRGGDYVYFILVSSAGVSSETRRAALAAGVDDFLGKPVDPEELGMRLHVAERILRFTAQVKQLESILPICGYCKKIRDDHNYWSQVEEYLNKRDGTRFSHGICPDCYQKVMAPQLEKLGLDKLASEKLGEMSGGGTPPPISAPP